MIERVEDASEIVIDHFYSVATVLCNYQEWRGMQVPIYEPLHTDLDISVEAGAHWHIDWRFVGGRRFFESITDLRKRFARADRSRTPHGMIVREQDSITAVKRQALRCYRIVDSFPEFAGWLPMLEAKYADKQMDCMRCPHRNLDLKGVEVINGSVVCPGHGLQWDVATGAMIPRVGVTVISAARLINFSIAVDKEAHQ